MRSETTAATNYVAFCRHVILGPGRTGQIFVYFAKKSVTSSLRKVRPVILRSTKFCQGLPNFKDAVVLPVRAGQRCVKNRTDFTICTAGSKEKVFKCAHDYQIENLAETNFVEIFGRTKQILSVQCFRTLSSIALRRKRAFNVPFCRTNRLKNGFIMNNAAIS